MHVLIIFDSAWRGLERHLDAVAAAAPGSLWERKVDSTWFQALRLSTQAPLPLDPNAFPVLQDQRAGTGCVRSATERWEGGKRKIAEVALKRKCSCCCGLISQTDMN